MKEINITLNGKDIKIPSNSSIEFISQKFNIPCNLYIVNSKIVDKQYILKDLDDLTLIDKENVNEEFLEYQLVARQGLDVYNILKKGNVIIAGIGGLGSNIATSLARVGVGNITIVDFDIVEPSNLNRQYYFINQLGLNKTDALETTLKNINPYIKVNKINKKITKDNIGKILVGYDIIIEAFDNTESKLLIAENVQKLFKDSFVILASGVAGYFDTSIIKKRKLGNNAIVIGDFENEADFHMGLMSPRVSVAANIQANEAVRYLLRNKS